MGSIDLLLAPFARTAAAVRRLGAACARGDDRPYLHSTVISGWSALAGQGPGSVEQQIARKKVLGYCREMLRRGSR